MALAVAMGSTEPAVAIARLGCLDLLPARIRAKPGVRKIWRSRRHFSPKAVRALEQLLVVCELAHAEDITARIKEAERKRRRIEIERELRLARETVMADEIRHEIDREILERFRKQFGLPVSVFGA